LTWSSNNHRNLGTIIMPAFASIWTAARVELLRRGFEAGLSCREIAVDIGVSRNAVIGKLSRLNLTSDKRGDAPPRKTPSKRRRTKPAVKLQLQALQAEYGPIPPVADEALASSEHSCTLLELSDHRCRWPIGEPESGDFRFCGRLSLDGQSYCAGHARLAYQPGSRQRVARG